MKRNAKIQAMEAVKDFSWSMEPFFNWMQIMGVDLMWSATSSGIRKFSSWLLWLGWISLAVYAHVLFFFDVRCNVENMSKAYGQGSSTSTPIHILMERIVVLAHTDFMLLGLLAMSVKQLPEIFQTIQSIGNQVAIDQCYKNQLRKVSLRVVLCSIIMVGLELN